MIDINRLKKAAQYPKKGAHRLNKEYNYRFNNSKSDAIKVFEEDWDNLIILDGCRYDLFIEAFNQSLYDVEKKISGGSTTMEFLEFNVSECLLDDVVWVSANPWVSDYTDSIFKVIHVWNKGWNEEYETVMPETMFKYGLNAANEYTDKRIIIHFMQPHFPFLGETSEKLPDHRSITGGGKISTNDDPTVWDHLDKDNVKKDIIWKCYKENLDIVLPYAQKLIDNLEGRTVLTSDHGNSLGDRGHPIPISIYGHKSTYRIPSLIDVPWVISEGGRRSIRSEKIQDVNNGDFENVQERLTKLGYK